MNLILVRESEASSETSDATDLSPDDIRTKHILTHLKKSTGDTVSVGYIDDKNNSQSSECGGNGYTCKCIILQRQNGGIRLVRKPSTILYTPSNLPCITVLLALPFPARLKYLWPVLSSFCYVTRIVVINSQLSDVEYTNSKALLPATYGPLIELGMSQGGRTRQVKVDICTGNSSNGISDTKEQQTNQYTRSWMENMGLVHRDATTGDSCDKRVASDDGYDDTTIRIFLDCGDENSSSSLSPPSPVRDIIIEQYKQITQLRGVDTSGSRLQYRPQTPSVIMAVGPERGWTDDEAKFFTKVCGYQSATLGPSILRVDVAVIAALGIVSSALDECQNKIINDDSIGEDNEPVTSSSSSSSSRSITSSPVRKTHKTKKDC